MKIGDKLYQLIYWQGWDNRFQVYTRTITKIYPKSVKVWGCDERIKKSEIGSNFFLTKKAMYKYYIKGYYEHIKPTLKAITLLKNRLKHLEDKEEDNVD
jgi:hypothetical protein